MVEDVANLIQKYRKFQDGEAQRYLQALQEGFQRISQGIAETRISFEKANRESAPGFNIFDILGVSDYEVRTHSAFLADLLNPAGKHGQRDLFIRSFIDTCHSKHTDFPLPLTPFPSSGWEIAPEKYCPPYGTLDIVISNLEGEFLVVIENKIWAGEQPEQLERYHKWMSSQREAYPKSGLVFLTPRGTFSQTIEPGKYYPLSYRHDIRRWLTGILDSIEADKVRYTVEQYLEIAKSVSL